MNYSYKLLGEQIVIQAKADYVNSCVILKAYDQKVAPVSDEKKWIAEYMKADCVNFFNSQWGESCGIVDPEYLIKKLDKVVEQVFHLVKKGELEVPVMLVSDLAGQKR